LALFAERVWMVEIKFLGACREVGRSGFQVTIGKDRFLLDYGYEVQHGTVPIEPEMPLSGVFVSHAHIDHSGMIPNLYRKGYEGHVYTTEATSAIMEILLRDSIKVQKKRGEQTHFLPKDIEKTMLMNKTLDYGKPVSFRDSKATLLDAGHIPGASGVLIEGSGKKILYTGDIKFEGTRLVGGARLDVKGLDALLIESTYSYKDHPDREELVDKLREICQETIYNNGFVVIPSFAVGRTQELLVMLYDLGFPIHLDGMGIEVGEVMLQNRKFLKDPKGLQKAFSRAHKVHGFKDRKNVLDKPGIIICTAGMMNGGPIHYYMQKLHDRENCTLCLTGFQVPGTVGRALMDTGRYVNEGVDVAPKMRMEFMDFSAHTDRDHIIGFIKRNRPKKVFLIHGDRTEEFADEIRKMGFDAEAPKNGDTATI
jgi:putative mRNA 3-end processing factor